MPLRAQLFDRAAEHASLNPGFGLRIAAALIPENWIVRSRSFPRQHPLAGRSGAGGPRHSWRALNLPGKRNLCNRGLLSLCVQRSCIAWMHSHAR